MQEEARDGADGVLLLSHGVWTRRFGADADIVGALVDLDGVGISAEVDRRFRPKWITDD